MRIVFTAEDIGGPEGVSILLAALSDGDTEVRGAAARALAFSPTVQVLKALIERLPREKGVVLGNLLETLGKSRRKELAPIIGKYLAYPDPEVVCKAVIAYALTAGKEGWEKACHLVVDGLRNDPKMSPKSSKVKHTYLFTVKSYVSLHF